MKRRLVSQAGSAITVTLPIEWIRKNGLKAGDEIDLLAHEKSIILNADKKSEGGAAVLDLKEISKRLKYIFINSAYAKGIDELEIKSEKGYYPDLNGNIGYAVIKAENNSFSIKDVSGISNESLDDIFKMVFQMIIRFCDSAIADMSKGSYESIEIIEQLDWEVNKYVLFLERAVMKMTYPDLDKGKIMFAYSFELEKISDDICRMWRNYINNKSSLTEASKKIVLLARDALQISFDSYYHSGYEKIQSAFNLKEDMRKKIVEISKKQELMIVFYALKIVEGCSDLTHLTLMNKIEKEN